ncbi:aminopeptidase [Emiliania huxleyi CCMP1516]|uniref:Cytosol aminopeptidase domain-containing protein n=2 Tax=Emiliania huxleyi TaxID=2903 RepID=A0A0D3JPQ5_EMIH1|nr:aminopeptidase [Emiliania huxleyi CCMP1516]EOD25490.1 aminopeptidase [Emiliania huxleyi CCMP1516]|eukprot:XP_005777919.1 aminopeptidase [Emiliania huxleyi CCMP1516]
MYKLRSRVFSVSLLLSSNSVAQGYSLGGSLPHRFSRGVALRGGASPRAAAAGAQEAATAVPLTSASLVASDAAASDWTGDMMVVPVWEAKEGESIALGAEAAALDAALSGAVADLIADSEFKGKAGSSAVVSLPRGGNVRKVAVVGMGLSTDFKISGARKFGATLATLATEQKPKQAAALLPTGPALAADTQQAAFEAAMLGLSPDTRYKSDADSDENKPPPLQALALLGADAGALARARSFSAGVLLTRGLVASPANYATPTSLAACAKEIADRFEGMTLTVLERAECEARGMGAYLGVSQGAVEPPKFIHLCLSAPGGGKPAKKIAYAGAGSMIEKMKFDMGGAGAVLGAARTLAEVRPAGVEVHFIVASCENMVSAEAMRPGATLARPLVSPRDILTASNKKTIEVLNTDAEGRLTLADALVYAEALGEVDTIVDVATLTGACIVALGPDYAGMWSSDEALSKALLDAAASHGELLWQMPLAPEYREQINSKIADLANLGAPGGGGSITAALFLNEFVKESAWAHLDIAGPVWNDKAGGATGYGVRTLAAYAEAVAA